MLFTLITSVLSGEAADAAGRAKRGIVAYLLAAIFALAGIGFLIGAAFVLAARRFGTVEAGLAFGLGFLVLALVVVGVHRFGASREKRRAAERRRTEVKALAGATALALLPTLLARGGIKTLALPALAAVAYAIYQENSRPPRGPGDPPPARD